MNIEEFICAVRKRPLMYIEKYRIDYVYYLIIGFLGSNLINKNSYSVDCEFQLHFTEWIVEWVINNVDPKYEKKSFFWHHIVSEIADEGQESLDLFFKLSDKFFEEFHRANIDAD